jgi:flagellar basal body-associated protein FliL
MNLTKILILIILVLLITASVIFFNIFSKEDKEKEEVNKNPSTIQERRNALKEVFK